VTAQQFADLQYGLLYVFGQPLNWMAVLLVVLGFLLSAANLFLGLFRRLARPLG